MATKVETYDHTSLSLMEATDGISMPPPYAQDATELRPVPSATSSMSSASLPEYATAVAGPSSGGSTEFYATTCMQIENQGLPVVALPLPPRPFPIPVYAVDGAGRIGAKAYESIRHSRGSGNAVLFRDGNPQHPVCSTTYRFGPGRPPKICLLGPDADVSSLGTDDDTPPPGAPVFEVNCKGVMTRAVSIRTDMGTFEWRHATRAEKRAVGADSLLLLEHVTPVALEGGRKKEEVRRRVAQLVRNAEFRTHGSGRSTAGNGGRLMMDLRAWADGKDEAQRVEVFAVASCIVMLKREMDRRRGQQAMMFAGGGGGP